jgi:phosphoribosylformimino-5-aminoimidazole carboxamide ribotide isomerase
MTTELFPAIDLLGGRCVRLSQGDYGRSTVYGDDPIAMAEGFIADGAIWVHIVDLDAAKGRGPINRSLIADVAQRCSQSNVRVQTGGGVRSARDAAELFAAGVARVVVGTAAVKNPEVVSEIAGLQAGDVAVGIDAHRKADGMWEAAVQGWTESSGVSLFDVLSAAVFNGATAVVATDISRDGMLTGPAVDLYRDLLEFRRVSSPALHVIASGGVASLADVVELASLEGLAGVIAGRAIYEGLLTVADGVTACRSGNTTKTTGPMRTMGTAE